MKKYTLLVVAAVFSLIAAGPVFAEELLIRGEIFAPDGTEVFVSAPVSLLETLKMPVPCPQPIDQGKMEELVDSLMEDIHSMKGQALLLVEGKKQEIRFWVDAVDPDMPEEANFLKVMVLPANEKQPEVNLRIPKGLFFLTSFVGNHIMETQGQQLFQMMQQHLPKPPGHVGGPHHPAPCPQSEKECPKAKEKKHEEKEHPKKEVDPEQLKKEIIKKIMKDLNVELD